MGICLDNQQKFEKLGKKRKQKVSIKQVNDKI